MLKRLMKFEDNFTPTHYHALIFLLQVGYFGVHLSEICIEFLEIEEVTTSRNEKPEGQEPTQAADFFGREMDFFATGNRALAGSKGSCGSHKLTTYSRQPGVGNGKNDG